jgi:hypothetical protein
MMLSELIDCRRRAVQQAEAPERRSPTIETVDNSVLTIVEVRSAVLSPGAVRKTLAFLCL